MTIEKEFRNLYETCKTAGLPSAIRHRPKMYAYIQTFYGDGILEKAYNAYNHLTDNDRICTRGNRKKFLNGKDGYGFCGRPNVCECAREHRSETTRAARAAQVKKYNPVKEKQKSLSEENKSLPYRNSEELLDIDFCKLKKFVEKNKMSYKRILKAFDPGLFEFIDTNYTGTKNFGENMWLFLNGYEDRLQCLCGKYLLFYNVTIGYSSSCQECKNK